jgi:hypothetical protein
METSSEKSKERVLSIKMVDFQTFFGRQVAGDRL